MRRLIYLVLLMAVLPLQSWAAGRDNYTVIISLDGLRWDYLDTYDVPFMQQLAREGVKAVMQPSFPSKTFPNHYTLATGLTPDHHGTNPWIVMLARKRAEETDHKAGL